MRIKACEKYFESILTDVQTREEHASSIGGIYHVSHASRHAHRDLLERHRTSDLNRITRTFVITRRGNAYILSVDGISSVHRDTKGYWVFTLRNRVVAPSSRNAIFIKPESNLQRMPRTPSISNVCIIDRERERERERETKASISECNAVECIQRSFC